MSSRRLKIKPKPTITNLIRKARDKEDSSSLTQNEKITNESSVTNEGSTVSSNKVQNLDISSETYNCNSPHINNLKSEHNVYEDKPPPKDGESNNSLEIKLGQDQGPEKILKTEQDLFLNIDASEQDRVLPNDIILVNASLGNDLNMSLMGNSNTFSSSAIPTSEQNGICQLSPAIGKISDATTEKSINLNNRNLSSDSVNTISSQESICNKLNVKPDSVKVLSRFSRSRCKPVLNIPGPRKKSEFKENESSSLIVPQLRTDSVIKCVQSELSKIDSSIKNKESISSLDIDKQEESCIKDSLTDNCLQNTIYSDDVQSIITDKNQISNNLQNTTSDKNQTSNNLQNTTSDKNQTANNLNVSDRSQISPVIEVSNEGSRTEIEVQVIEESNSNSEKIDSANEKHEQLIKSSPVSKPTTPNKVLASPLRAASKMLLPKPSPRLTDSASRRISFHTSDSEEEIKKNNVDKRKKRGNEKKERQLKDRKRKHSQGPTFAKLGQGIMGELEKKLNASKGNLDKTKLRMLDLIFYNPKDNPMSVPDQTPVEEKKEAKIEVSQAVEEALEEQNVDDVEPTDGALPVPQLKVGPDGEVMLDPQSLVIETTGLSKGRQELENSQLIRENGITRYNTYSKVRNKRRDWSQQETLQFYRALNTIGTDFSMMTQLFPKRTRHELKLKFKREERNNMHLIDRAMTVRSNFDFQFLEAEMKRENEEMQRKQLEAQIAKEASKKQRAERKEELKKKMDKIEKELNKKVEKRLRRKKWALIEGFSNGDSELLFEEQSKKPAPPKKRKRKEKINVKTDSDEELEMFIDSDSDSDENLNTISSAALRECEEINETLQKKLELESQLGNKLHGEPESEEDGYTPNDPNAYMLYGSPQRDLEEPEEELTQGEREDQWSIKIQSLPAIEDTVMVENIEEVSELSELGSFGQNDVALDLSIPVRANVAEGSQREQSIFNRHLISESIQIIDQLTSAENHDTPMFTHEEDENEESGDNPFRLPSFESVSRIRHSMAFSLPSDSSNCGPEVVNENQDNRSERDVYIANFYRESDECILGD